MHTQALAAALLIATAACEKSPTEIVLTIDTSFGVPCTIDKIVVDVTTSSGETETETVDVTSGSLPGSLTLIASSAPGQLTVRVTGFLGETAVAVAEERAVTFEDEVSKELRFLLDSKCSPSSPCAAVAKGEFTDLPAPVARIECGQERYTSRESLALLTNSCAGGTLGSVLTAGDDEVEAQSPLDPAMPFPFFFYGRPVNDVWVGDNGYLAFSEEAPAALNENVGDPRSLGETGFPVGGILPFWDKLRVSQRVCFSVEGAEPNRLMWVTWDRACFGPGTCGPSDQGTLTFSVGLEETTNSIHLGYHQMVATGANVDRAKGLSAVIGIFSGNAPECSADACDDNGLCPNGNACGYSEFSALTSSLDPIPQIEFRPVTP